MPPLTCGANQPVGSSPCFRKANHRTGIKGRHTYQLDPILSEN